MPRRKADAPDTENSGLSQPKQSQHERAELRSKYRKLIQETESTKSELAQPASKGLAKALDEADMLFHQVKKPREAALDAELLQVISNIGVEQSQKLQTGFKVYDTDGFIRKLQAQLAQPNGWAVLAERSHALRQRTPAFDCMLGPLSLEPTERKPRKAQQQRQQLGPETRPDKVTESPETDMDKETANRVQIVKQYLTAKGPINYFVFVIDPADFAQTVENIFHVSFLIKEGSALMRLGADGLPEIVACEPPSDEQIASGLAVRKQTVIEFDMPRWRRLIELLDIKSAVLPPRSAAPGVASAAPRAPNGTTVSPARASSQKKRSNAKKTSKSRASSEEESGSE